MMMERSTSCEEPPQKRAKPTLPLTIASWNCNSESVRLQKNLHEHKQFLQQHHPSFFLRNGLWLPAYCSNANAKIDDGQRRDRTRLDEGKSSNEKGRRLIQDANNLRAYADAGYPTMLLSLADGRSAGTGVAIRSDTDTPLAVAYTFETIEKESRRFSTTVDFPSSNKGDHE